MAEPSALPEHWSWFNLLENEQTAEAAHHLSWPLNHEGKTWMDGAHIDIEPLLASLGIALLLTIFGFITKAKLSDPEKALIPSKSFGIASFMELTVGAVFGMMSDMMGKKAAKFFLPLIGTCALVIFASNVMGLVPGFQPPTGNLSISAGMAIIIFFATHIFGLKENGMAHIKHLFGPVWWLAPLIFVIECISHLVRPVTLAIRLTANMFADHAVLTIFLGLVGSLFFIPLALPMYFMGCIVVTVQTLVFCLLSTVYIAMAIEHHDHDDHEHAH